jgi:hypothetical protein
MGQTGWHYQDATTACVTRKAKSSLCFLLGKLGYILSQHCSTELRFQEEQEVSKSASVTAGDHACPEEGRVSHSIATCFPGHRD